MDPSPFTNSAQSEPPEAASRRGINASAHRQNRNYSRKILLARVLWSVLYPFFRFSPRHLYNWRNFLLRRMGATIGRNVRIYPSARIFYPWNLHAADGVTIGWDCEIYSLGQITLGPNAMVSQRAHLCAGSHDYTQPHYPLLTPPITVEAGAWICADAFVGPGVTVGEGAIVAARAVVTKHVAPSTVVGGNPAKVIRAIDANPEGASE